MECAVKNAGNEELLARHGRLSDDIRRAMTTNRLQDGGTQRPRPISGQLIGLGRDKEVKRDRREVKIF